MMLSVASRAPTSPAADGRVDVADALLVRGGRELARDDRRDRAHVDDQASRARVREDLADDLLHLRRVGQHRDDHVGLLGKLTRRLRPRGALHVAPREAVDDHVVAGVDEVARHRRAHHAESDEADHASAPSGSQASVSSVGLVGLYSRPTQPS
jgi:hypothetical protein